MTHPWYTRAYRRMLVDMHIADWDEAFLADYDPRVLADCYEQARLASVMFYCQSHVGLCYWPTRSGEMHANLHGRDIVAEMLAELRRRDIAACAYYSVIFNIWAFREHPDWRMVPADQPPAAAFANARHGLCCPNNPAYRAFALAQAAELATDYAFDGFFFDMTFWPHVCVCPHCRAEYRRETGREIPRTIDWRSPDWCAFQSARERWITEFAGELSACVKALRPGVTAYHNFATALFSWRQGASFASAVHHDFLGADFYGDPLEQLVVIKLMSNLSQNRPAEFMTSRCVHLYDHVRMKPRDLMRIQAFAATLFSAAFLFIDAIDIRGTVNPHVYERVGDVFSETAPYEPWLGGDPIEDIAVYFSDDARMDFTENGLSLSGPSPCSAAYPHAAALRGACRALQQAHLPFGVITRKQLDALDQYKLVILPNILRMRAEEADAFRRYVRNGGRLYASRYTSLTDSSGSPRDDFMLADVFGCHLADDDLGEFVYMKPASDFVADAIAPQDYLSLCPLQPAGRSSALRLSPSAEATVLGTLTLPYAHPAKGTVFDNDWASFHSAPPWQDTDAPVLVRNPFGAGEAIYCAADIETHAGEADASLFTAIIRALAGADLSFEAEAHPAVWTAAFRQPRADRITLGFLNYQTQLPPAPLHDIPFRLRPPHGRRFDGLYILPDQTPLDHTIDPDGLLHAVLPRLDLFQLLLAPLR